MPASTTDAGRLGGLRQDRESGALRLAALDRVQVGDVALAGAKGFAVGSDERHRISLGVRRQHRITRLVAGAVALARLHGPPSTRSITGMSSMIHSTRTMPSHTIPGGVPIVGWDIGGANTKGARWIETAFRTVSAPLEMPRESRCTGPDVPPAGTGARRRRRPLHAVTMTAELSQAFRTKREGVGFVLDAMAEAFPGRRPCACTASSGDSSTPRRHGAMPLEVAAANWAATARFVGRQHAPTASWWTSGPPPPTSFRSWVESRRPPAAPTPSGS